MKRSYAILLLVAMVPLGIMASNSNEIIPSSALEFQQTTDTRIAVEATHLRFFTGNTERMTIDASGKVGIGTENPNYPLTVRNDKGIDAGSYKIASFTRMQSGDGNAGVNISYQADGTVATRTKLYFPGGIGATFQLYNAGVQDVLHLNSNGNVGIGTTSPTYKLHVSGIVRAVRFVSDTQTYADFVFEDDYQLPTLTEVEDFIEKNNHLPDIPSEKEAIANGVDLQMMQARLLQKIEELTLYVIEQDKKIESQQKRIQNLEAQTGNNLNYDGND